MIFTRALHSLPGNFIRFPAPVKSPQYVHRAKNESGGSRANALPKTP
ncbi:hypothetical protein ACKI2N_021775 [Cupriavidus sp. 30B13]